MGVGLAQECLACDECASLFTSLPPFKFSLCWSLPTPAAPAPAVFTSYELGSPCLVDFKALPIRCKDAQLGTHGVITQALCWREVRGLWYSQGSSGSFGCCTEEIESTMSWHRQAQRDCKQSGPGWTVRLFLLCFHYRTKGQKGILLLTICAKFSGKLPRAAEQ